MTWLELKNHIRDLGFETDITINDTEFYPLVINSVNLSISIIRDIVVSRLAEYFKANDPEWEMPAITKITTGTEDDFEIELPEIVQKLIPYLSAYHVWLDDDERKAVYYYNLYEDLKEQLIAECTRPKTARIEGGMYL